MCTTMSQIQAHKCCVLQELLPMIPYFKRVMESSICFPFLADTGVIYAQLYSRYRHINAVSSRNCSLNSSPLMFPVFKLKGSLFEFKDFFELIQGLNMLSSFACC